MYHIIFNPKSKGSRGKDACRIVLAQLKVRALPFVLHTTDHPRHAEELARELTEANTPCTILVIGGDGTVNEVLNGIKKLSLVTLGLIPSGSGNDFARAMHIPKDPQKALECILRGKTTAIHYGIMSSGRHNRRFMISCGTGFDSEVCRDVHHSRLKKLLNHISLGNLVYGCIAVRNLLFRTVFSAHMVSDQTTEKDFHDITFVTAFNSAFEGGGFCFCPAASPEKTALDIVCIHDVPLYKIPLLFPLAKIGHHLRFTRMVDLTDTRQTDFTFSRPVSVHTDGEVLGQIRNLHVEVSSDTLQFYQ